MKFGRTLMELAQELDRQRNAKHDYLLDTRNIIMDSADGGQTRFEKVVKMMRDAKGAKIITSDIPQMIELASSDYGFTKKESSGILDHLIRDGEFSLYGLANAVTRAAQDVESYDRSTEMESIGYSILGMSRDKWNRLNAASVA